VQCPVHRDPFDELASVVHDASQGVNDIRESRNRVEKVSWDFISDGDHPQNSSFDFDCIQEEVLQDVELFFHLVEELEKQTQKKINYFQLHINCNTLLKTQVYIFNLPLGG